MYNTKVLHTVIRLNGSAKDYFTQSDKTRTTQDFVIQYILYTLQDIRSSLSVSFTTI